MVDDGRESWFKRFHPTSEARTTLLCLPYAGGSASFFLPLARSIGSDVEVLAVQYPGRQDRWREPFMSGIPALADRIAALLAEPDGRDLAVFGHSMGASIAFEVTTRLEAAGRDVSVLFVSGQRAPSRHRSDGVHLRSDAAILTELQTLDGPGAALMSDAEVARMFLPVIRNDYRALETHRPDPDARVQAPVTAFAGEQDPRVLVSEVADWNRHTSGEFALHLYRGGHFFLSSHQVDMTRRMRDTLRAVART